MADFLGVRLLSNVFRTSLLTFQRGQVTGWAGLIRVDGVPYVWMGNPTFPSGTTVAQVNQTSFEYTSTKSIFTQNVNNKVGLVVTFLSPVTPTDYVRGSLVSSYLDVQVYSLDGNTHDVQIYTDISAGKSRLLIATVAPMLTMS